jgi:hypothetical protein
MNKHYIIMLMLLYFLVNITYAVTPNEMANKYNVTLLRVVWINNSNNKFCGYAYFSGKVILNHACDNIMDYVIEHEVRHVKWFRYITKKQQNEYCINNSMRNNRECWEWYADDFSVTLSKAIDIYTFNNNSSNLTTIGV